MDIQHEHQRGVFLHVILHGSQTVGVGVVVVRHVVKGAVVEDGNATLRQGGGDLVATRTTLQASLSVRKLPVGVYSCPAGMV